MRQNIFFKIKRTVFIITAFFAVTLSQQVAGQTPCGSIEGGTITNSGSNTFCGLGTDTLTLMGASMNGTTVQWQQSINGGNTWADISWGTNTAVIATGTITGTIDYRVKLTCIADTTDSVFSDTYLISVTPYFPPPVVSTVLLTPGDSVICAGITSAVVEANVPSNASANGYTSIWTVNGQILPTATTGGFYYPQELEGNDTVTFMSVSNAACLMADTVYSDTIIIKVNPNLTPAVIITADPGTDITPGQPVTFTAVTTDAGAVPTYQWQLNDTDIPGATASTYTSSTFSNNDLIVCQVISNATCAFPYAASSNPLVIYIASNISSASEGGRNIRLFPNPNTGLFNIEGNISDSKQAQIEVLNIIGQEIYSAYIPVQNGRLYEQITLPGINANGVYMVRIKTDTENEIIQFVMQK